MFKIELKSINHCIIFYLSLLDVANSTKTSNNRSYSVISIILIFSFFNSQISLFFLNFFTYYLLKLLLAN